MIRTPRSIVSQPMVSAGLPVGAASQSSIAWGKPLAVGSGPLSTGRWMRRSPRACRGPGLPGAVQADAGEGSGLEVRPVSHWTEGRVRSHVRCASWPWCWSQPSSADWLSRSPSRPTPRCEPPLTDSGPSPWKSRRQRYLPASAISLWASRQTHWLTPERLRLNSMSSIRLRAPASRVKLATSLVSTVISYVKPAPSRW